MRSLVDQTQGHADRRGRAVGALERHSQRVEQAREHERQGFEFLDRPLEFDRLNEPRHTAIGHERPRIDAACEALQRYSFLTKSCRHLIGRQRGKLSDGADPPPFQNVEGARCEGCEGCAEVRKGAIECAEDGQ